MWKFLILVAIFKAEAASAGCKHCVMSKADRAMFTQHWDTCLTQSGADRAAAEGLLRGELGDGNGTTGADVPEVSPGAVPSSNNEGATLRRHVLCVLRACKLVGKDGKLRKAAVLRRLAAKGRPDDTKVIEECSEQAGDTPEDLAWNIFRCSFEKKAVLFDYMPTGAESEENENNSTATGQ